MSLVFREDLLGSERTVHALTAAFGEEGTVRLVFALDLLAELVRAVAGHLDDDRWFVGVGAGPDDLAERARGAPLATALGEAGLEEICCVLAQGFRADPDRLVPARLARFLPAGSPVLLALRTEAASVGAAVGALRFQGGEDMPLWITEASLTVRFSVQGDELGFKAHHPVVDDELRAFCRRRGLDM